MGSKYTIVLLLAFWVGALGYYRDKLARRPNSQPKFMLDRWLGEWYLQARLASCSWAGSREFEDWFQVLTMERGKVLATETWYNNICTTASAILTQSKPGRGCFVVKDTLGNVWSGDIVVPATDYKTFSISWGCTKKSVDGETCDDTWLTVKTRQRNPSPYTWKVVDAILRKLFDLSLEEMKRIQQRNRC